MAIEIVDVRTQGDNLFVDGVVDGITCHGHGWVARTNTMTKEEQRGYMEELLLNGKPAGLDAFKVHITAPAVPAKPPAIGWFKKNRALLLQLLIAAGIAALIAYLLWL